MTVSKHVYESLVTIERRGAPHWRGPKLTVVEVDMSVVVVVSKHVYESLATLEKREAPSSFGMGRKLTVVEVEVSVVVVFLQKVTVSQKVDVTIMGLGVSVSVAVRVTAEHVS